MHKQTRLRIGELSKLEERIAVRGYWVVRPIIIHESKKVRDDSVCPCGCNSTRAVAVETREHIEVLVDIWKRRRKVRSKLSPEGQAKFDEIARSGAYKKVYAPLRCSRKQLRVVLDRRTPIISINGGQRGGKTTVAGEWFFDQLLMLGGRGAKFLWAAPGLKQTWTGIDKLLNGEATDRDVRPIIPPELIVKKPKGQNDKDMRALLVDGTLLFFMHAGEDGDNLKSFSFRGAVLDEGASVNHETNLDVILGRLSDSGGQLLIPTTPKYGHWLKDRVVDLCVTYDEAEAGEAQGREWPAMVTTALTFFDNPWQDPEIIMKRIEAAGGMESPAVKREYLGMWVANGDRLWPHFGDQNLVEMSNRENFEQYGYINITHKVVRSRFLRSESARRGEIAFFLGMDFNCTEVCPPTVVVCRILVRHGDPQDDPRYWILYAEDEITKKSPSMQEFSQWAAREAGALNGRGLHRAHFAGAHGFGDPTGFFHGQRGQPRTASPDAKIFEDAGFVVEPPERKGGKPTVIPVDVRMGLMNDLMFHRTPPANDGDYGHVRFLVNRQRCPNLIDALENQADDGGGRAAKRTHSASDRMAGFTDALGYAAYGAFSPWLKQKVKLSSNVGRAA